MSNGFASASHLSTHLSAVDPEKPPICVLFDNGSLRPESILSLRRTARALEEKIGVEVKPASWRYSDRVDPKLLDGERAELLLPVVRARLANDEAARVVLLPLFFGPVDLFRKELPGTLETWRTTYPRTSVQLADCLVKTDEPDTRVAGALASAVERVMAKNGLAAPLVVLVDHGSPTRAVTAVRDHLGRQLATLLRDQAATVAVASMERRPEAEYSFNEPLLADILRRAPFDRGDVVVALQFLSPGRHAGTGGDIDSLCAAARRENEGLRTHITDTLAGSPQVLEVLADRYRWSVAAG